MLLGLLLLLLLVLQVRGVSATADKHKRLFTGGPGALERRPAAVLQDGAGRHAAALGGGRHQPRTGVSGIRCDCCNQVGGGGDA